MAGPETVTVAPGSATFSVERAALPADLAVAGRADNQGQGKDKPTENDFFEHTPSSE
jgi:hypothetical protein